MKLFAALIAGVSALAFATPALAVGNPADGLQAMRELNLIALGDAQGNSQHVQGKAFIGGNLTGNLTVAQDGSHGFTQNVDRAELTVGGNAETWLVEHNLDSASANVRIGGNSTGTGTLNATGHVDVGGNINIAGFNPNSTKTVTYGGTISEPRSFTTHDVGYADPATGLKATIAKETATLADDLTALSVSLKDLGQTAAQITDLDTPLTFSGGGDFYVFNMDEAVFEQNNSNIDQLFANLPTDATVVINVAGTDLDVASSSKISGGASNIEDITRHVLWNFADAETLDVGEWFGSILAPGALLTNHATITGSMAVGSVAVANGEIHLGTFDGDLPPAPTVPEPATWAMMLAGFGLVGLVTRARRGRRTLAAV